MYLNSLLMRCRGLPGVVAVAGMLALSACGGGSSQDAGAAAAPSATTAQAADRSNVAVGTVPAGALGRSTTAASPGTASPPAATSPPPSTSPPITSPPATAQPAALAFSAGSYAVAQTVGAVTVTVNRSGGLGAAVSVGYATADGSAAAGSAYTAARGFLSWAANDSTSRTFSVPISDTLPFAGTKSFSISLSNPSTSAAVGAPGTAVVAISGNAASGNLQLAAGAYTVAENAGSLLVTVTRSGGANGAVSVEYASGGGTAVAGTNYATTRGTLSWANGDSASKSVSIPIMNVPAMSANVAFSVTLSAPAGGAALGSVATSTVTITPVASQADLAIRVSGNHLIDANGKTVQLRGVNVSGLESVAIQGWDPGNPWGGQTGDSTPNWSTIKTWGVNAVRLPLNEASWLGLSCIDIGGTDGTPGAIIKADPGANYQATVAQSVADATAAGLYVILDLHWAAPNDGATPACPTTQNPMADADHSAAFWQSIASRFKSNPAVIFELFNEPFLNSAALVGSAPWPDLLNGGAVTQVYFDGGSGVMNLTWSTAGMQSLLNAVRATGATNVVLTSTLAYASQMDGWLKYMPTDPAAQLGAVWHAYPSSQYPSQVSCVADDIVTVWLPQCSALEMAAVQQIVAAGYPVVVTEFGDSIGGSAPWASVLLPFADNNGISYLGWTWDVWGGASANVLITDAAGDPTPGFGVYVKQHYLCRASGTAQCR